MSARSYFAGVYWTARFESPEECAQRAETFFRLLAKCDPEFERWYETADSLEEALARPFVPDQPTLLRLLEEEGRNEDSFGLGFSAWTGHTEEEEEEEGRGAGVSLTCGRGLSNSFPNECELRLAWSRTPKSAARLTLSTLSAIMRALVMAWEPEWGVIVDADVRTALSQESGPAAHVGWLTYIAREWGRVPVLPDAFRVEAIEDKGTLVVLTEQPLSLEQPQSMDLARRVQRELTAQGLLRRIYPS